MTALIGYARISKADGSQVHDLQRDALIKAVYSDHIYEDAASGRRDDRPVSKHA
jgi:DNA invertase Pin-like site-specific DNA recombinase